MGGGEVRVMRMVLNLIDDGGVGTGHEDVSYTG